VDVLQGGAQEIGVFRWRVISEAFDPSLFPRERWNALSFAETVFVG